MRYLPFVLTIVLLAIGYQGFLQNSDCSEFKTGTFKLLDASVPNYLIVRNDSIQTETAKSSIVSTDFYIRWVDDCSYELTYKKMHNRPSSIKLPDKPIKLFVRIYKVSGDTCWVETRANTSDYVSKQRMVKIN